MALNAKNQSWIQLRVGLTAVFALAMLGVLIFFMTSNQSFFKSETRLLTYFVSSGGISAGQPVRLNGILAGTVDKVELSGDLRPERTVRITMLVDNRLLKEIPVDSTAQVGSENLLSGRYLAILRGLSKTPVAANGEIRSKVQPEIDDMKTQGLQMLESANSILAKIEGIVKQVMKGFPRSTYRLEIKPQYRNMKQVIDRHPEIVDYAIEAIRRAGLKPVRSSIRGGTDGSRLSFMGLPCPNIFAGEHAFHSRLEWVSRQDMEKAAETIVHLAMVWEERA